MNTIPAKTILSNYSENGWFGCNYNMNIYKGCCHGCIYCDSRSECYNIDNFDEVKAKENALEIIERDLRSKRKSGIIGTGAMSDPYNPFEKQYELTRGALKLINKYGFGISLITKSNLAVRDIDIFTEIKKHSPVCVKYTITTIDDELCKKIEQHVSLTSERLKAINQISSNNITTGVLLMPLLPFINDTKENILGIIQSCSYNGAKFIYPAFGVTLRQNQRLYFYNKLDEQFPNIKQKYINAFGNQYECNSENSKMLWYLFKNECEKLNIKYRMSDIITLINNGYEQEQLSFF